jgi:hypothetical protein
MTAEVSKFKAEILKEVGKVVISPDLEHRVLLVRDEENMLRVSAQVWWKDETDTFNPGKGYFLTGRRAISLSKVMGRAIQQDSFSETVTISNTQKYLVDYSIEADTLMVNKWWRKSEEEEWTFGKSLAITTEKAVELISLLDIAGSMIIHAR